MKASPLRTTPAPTAPHMLSPAPPAIGSPGVSRQRWASSGRSAALMAPLATRRGSTSVDIPLAVAISADHVPASVSISKVADASARSETASPLNLSRT